MTKKMSSKPPQQASIDDFIKHGISFIEQSRQLFVPWESEACRISPNSLKYITVRMPLVYKEKVKWVSENLVHNSQNKYILDLIKEDIDKRLKEIGYD